MQKRRILYSIAVTALMSATSVSAQSTEGEDAINSLTELFSGAASDTFDSDGVAQRLILRYSQIETNEWSFLDSDGNTVEGSGEVGRSLSIGRRSRGLEYEGGGATYGFGLKYTEIGEETDDLSFEYVGGFVDAGFG